MGLVVIAVAGVLGFLGVRQTPARNDSLSGFEIRTNCSGSASACISLQPFGRGVNPPDLEVGVSIDEFNGKGSLEAHVPGVTVGHRYLLPFEKPAEWPGDDYRRPMNGDHVTHTPLGDDVVRLGPADKTDFHGAFEFVLCDGLRRTRFDEYTLTLPFGALQVDGEAEPLPAIQHYTISIACPSRYEVTSTHQLGSARRLGNVSFYNMSIDGGASLLCLRFRDAHLSTVREVLTTVVCPVLFCLGVAILFIQRGGPSSGSQSRPTAAEPHPDGHTRQPPGNATTPSPSTQKPGKDQQGSRQTQQPLVGKAATPSPSKQKPGKNQWGTKHKGKKGGG